MTAGRSPARQLLIRARLFELQVDSRAIAEMGQQVLRSGMEAPSSLSFRPASLLRAAGDKWAEERLRLGYDPNAFSLKRSSSQRLPGWLLNSIARVADPATCNELRY